MRDMDQYISRKDLICWLLKQGTENGKLNVAKTLSLDEIMHGINKIPAIRMADKEKLLEFGIWQMVSPEEKSTDGTVIAFKSATCPFISKCLVEQAGTEKHDNKFRYELMRDATKEERESVNKYVKSISQAIIDLAVRV